MPRQPRLDAPGALHHIMGRSIERTRIFRTDQDREDFLNRLGDLCADGDLIVYAWALMPNHFHLLVRTGRQSISKSMRRLLTGCVINFNLRHKRRLFCQLAVGRMGYPGAEVARFRSLFLGKAETPNKKLQWMAYSHL